MKNQKDSNQTTRKVKDKMTKKDYIKIAATLKENHPTVDNSMQALSVWNVIVLDFADMLAKDNPLFDRHRFLVACGYTE